MFEHTAAPDATTAAPEKLALHAGDTRRRADKNVRSTSPAPWQLISGITPENELTMPPRERRIALRKLFAKVTELLREQFVQGASCPLVFIPSAAAV